jgi:SAM-dependent methyltransferase
MDAYEQTRLVYERSARELEADWDASPRVRHAQLALKLAGSPRPAVLELGCGPGRDAAMLVPLASDYVGIDYSSELIKIAKAKVPGAKLVAGDMVATPFPPNRDVVVAFASVLHLPPEQLKKVLQKIHDCLRVGGVLYISTKAGRGTETKTDSHGTRTYYLYNAADIERLAGPGYRTVHSALEPYRHHDWTELALAKRASK